MKKLLHKNNAAALLAILVLTVGSLAGCQPASEKTSSGTSSLRIALFPNITHAQGLVGKENGDFQKAVGSNVKITWTSFNAGPDETQAFMAGSEDIGYIGPGPAISAYVQSHGDIQIIAGSTDAGELLVSRKGVAISSVKDLAGKKVGVPQFGNTQHLTLLHLLKDNHLKPTTQGGTVEVVEANNSDVQSLFEKGQLDAALVPEPWGSTLFQKAGATIVLDEKSIWRNGQYATAVVIARKDYIDKHPDIVENFLKAHVALTKYINQNPEKAEQAVNGQIQQLTQKQLSSDILAASFKRLSVVNDPAKSSVKDFYTFSKDAGYIKGSDSLSNLFNLTALNKVLKASGEKTIS